jgi:phage gp36-like protein
VPYTSQSDIEIAAGGTVRLLELTDLDNDGTVSQAALLQAQTAAEEWIHSYAQKRFGVPFPAPIPSLIKQHAAQETVYRLMQLRQMVPDWAKEQHDERHMWLQDLAKGLVTPGVEPTPLKSTEVVPQILDRDDDDASARNSLRGFW